MVRTQIQLTEDQARRLKRRAAEEGCSMAELIRRSVERLLAAEGASGDEEGRHRALEVSGRFRSGLKDLAREHDRYLVDACDP